MPTDATELVNTTKYFSETRRTLRVLFDRPVVVAGAVVVALVVIMAVFAPFIAPYQSNDQNLLAILQPPSGAHWPRRAARLIRAYNAG